MWTFTFSRDYFSQEYRKEVPILRALMNCRGYLLSFALHILAEIFRIESEEGPPDLTSFDPLPVDRTHEALTFVYQALRAFSTIAPGLIDADEEFRGFLDALRREEKDIHDTEATDELTLLSQMFDAADDGLGWTGIAYEHGHLIGPASAFSKVIHEWAAKQRIQLAKPMSAVNVGKWFNSEVKNAKLFTVKKGSRGTGPQKREVWIVGRKVEMSPESDSDNPITA
jgi:hypothetical protein